MGRVIPFPGRRGRSVAPMASLPAPFTAEWQEEHLPLIDAAMDLLQADDAEFERRFKLIADTDGHSFLEELSAQLERLGSHVGDVVDALTMTATRIRTTMAALPA